MAEIISLIKEYAKDETVIGDYKLDFENHGFYISSFKFNLNVFSMKSFFVYKYKFISNSFFYSNIDPFFHGNKNNIDYIDMMKNIKKLIIE